MLITLSHIIDLLQFHKIKNKNLHTILNHVLKEQIFGNEVNRDWISNAKSMIKGFLQ